MTTRRAIAPAAALAALALAAAPMPAQAANHSDSSSTSGSAARGIVSAGNGTAGVAQTVSVYSPPLAGTTVEVVAWNGNAASTIDVTLNARGQGSGTWTPLTSGRWTVGASGAGLTMLNAKANIAPVPTVTEMYLPEKGTRYQPMGLISVVTATDGAAPVTGTVTFYEGILGRLGSVQVTSLPGERAIANFTWTPPDEGTYTFTSSFEPANDPDSATPAVQASVSPVGTMQVLSHRVLVQLLMPPVMRIGKPALTIVQLPDIVRGTVSLLVDGRDVGEPRETDGGITAFTWIPTHTGLTYVEAELHQGIHPQLAGLSRPERTVTQTINVQPRPVPNPISVTPIVDGKPEKPWADGDVLDYPAGTRISLVMSTGNGAAVTLEQKGTCAISGSTLVTPVRGGGCTVRFSAPGDARFSANSASVIVSSYLTAGEK